MNTEINVGSPALPEERAHARTLDIQAQPVVQVLDIPEGCAPRTAVAGSAPVVASSNPLHGVKATLKACIGHTEVSIGQLLDAKAHDVLTLDGAIDDPVDLLLNGVVIARGTLVAVDGQFGIRLTELPCPLTI